MRSLLTPAGCPGLPQGANLYSPDGTAYLVAVYTGRVVLANAALAKNDPNFYQRGHRHLVSPAPPAAPTP